MQGAVAAFFPDFQEGGAEAGKMIARILHGESPGSIPFYQVKKTKVIVNPKAGITVPPDVVKKADTVVGEGAKPK
jgi:putative ABC transport system substrate-binding protein